MGETELDLYNDIIEELETEKERLEAANAALTARMAEQKAWSSALADAGDDIRGVAQEQAERIVELEARVAELESENQYLRVTSRAVEESYARCDDERRAIEARVAELERTDAELRAGWLGEHGRAEQLEADLKDAAWKRDQQEEVIELLRQRVAELEPDADVGRMARRIPTRGALRNLGTAGAYPGWLVEWPEAPTGLRRLDIADALRAAGLAAKEEGQGA